MPTGAAGAGSPVTPRRDASVVAPGVCRIEGLSSGTPVLAASLHGGSRVSEDLRRFLALSDAERWREEDAGTRELADAFEARIQVNLSRFEVDLNRPPEQAVSLAPEETWGIEVWRRLPPPEILERSRRIHRGFYLAARRALLTFGRRHRRFVVLDLHSYDERRRADGRPASPAESPEIDLGTASMNRRRWGTVIDRFSTDLVAAGIADVRENVRFLGGFFPAWVHGAFGDRACAIAVEVKKTFIDEWTGRIDTSRLARVERALQSTVPGLGAALERVR
jgi:N-formylglutamate deformylase